LLSGRAPGGASLPSRTICACFAVSDDRIRNAIDELGLTNCDAVGQHLQAGTNCGSCRPEIEALLRQVGLAPLPGAGSV